MFGLLGLFVAEAVIAAGLPTRTQQKKRLQAAVQAVRGTPPHLRSASLANTKLSLAVLCMQMVARRRPRSEG